MTTFLQPEPGHVRRPARAGQFYTADPTELRAMVEGFLREAKTAAVPPPKAIIAPHAGYVFSGAIAASAYAALASARHTITRVVMFGPSHQASFEGLAVPSDDAFVTPLGAVPVDTAVVKDLPSLLPQVIVLDEAHAWEHSLEVHLPFLQCALADFEIIPLLVCDASEEEVALVMEALWGGDETCFVISSDLSHYHRYTRACELDAATARAIEDLRPQDIGEEQACGGEAIRAFLRVAERHGLRAHTVDLRNSGDTAGPRSEVVGYGAWVFW